MNDILHWLPFALPSIAFAVGWGLTQAKLSRVIEDLKQQRDEQREENKLLREENKELRTDLHEVREDLHKLRESVVRLEERTGRHKPVT